MIFFLRSESIVNQIEVHHQKLSDFQFKSKDFLNEAQGGIAGQLGKPTQVGWG